MYLRTLSTTHNFCSCLLKSPIYLPAPQTKQIDTFFTTPLENIPFSKSLDESDQITGLRKIIYFNKTLTETILHALFPTLPYNRLDLQSSRLVKRVFYPKQILLSPYLQHIPYHKDSSPLSPVALTFIFPLQQKYVKTSLYTTPETKFSYKQNQVLLISGETPHTVTRTFQSPNSISKTYIWHIEGQLNS